MEVQEIFAILHKWGIHTLGQLAAWIRKAWGATWPRSNPHVGACQWTIQSTAQNWFSAKLKLFGERFGG